jgi:hypothetical protein
MAEKKEKMSLEAREKYHKERLETVQKKLKDKQQKEQIKNYERLKPFTDILENVIERELTADDLEKFREYANGKGREWIIKAMNE